MYLVLGGIFYILVTGVNNNVPYSLINPLCRTFKNVYFLMQPQLQAALLEKAIEDTVMTDKFGFEALDLPARQFSLFATVRLTKIIRSSCNH